MREIITIALFFVLLSTGAEARIQKSNLTPAESAPPSSLNLNLDDNGAAPKDSGAGNNEEKNFSEIEKKYKKQDDDSSGEPGKFQLKPEFDFVDNDYDYDPHNKGNGEEMKLHLNYNF